MDVAVLDELEARFASLMDLEDAISVLHWDASTIMPDGAASGRADQLATLRTAVHERLVAPDMADLIAAAESRGADDPWRRANLAEIRRRHAHAAALPADLVAALSRACSECEQIWRRARRDSDFAAVRPALQRVLDLTREVARIKSEALGLSPFDTLIDEYEPGLTAARIDPVFDDLAAFLPGFLDDAMAAQARRGLPLALEGPFPVDRQKALGRAIMERLGFDFERGRLDVSLHPFCGGTPDDVRLTTRYADANFTEALMGVIHETGHALYEQGLPASWRRQPVGRALGMAIHESQSLLFEMQACRSREFLIFAAPLMADTFGGTGPEWSAENLYRLYTRVEPDFIRVDADEVTYPAHVILRYRLERALIAGDLSLKDLPAAWNDAFRALLGLDVPDDARGCLQDIHWYDGAFGYFPTYTLGAITAAQLFAAAVRANPDIPDCIARGDFNPLLSWLRQSVHAQGRLLSADALIESVTGAPLSPDVFKAHLKRRYLDG